MKRRFFIVLAIMILSAMLLSGCSSAPAASNAPNGEITYFNVDQSHASVAPAMSAPAASAMAPAPAVSDSESAAKDSGNGVSGGITGDTGIDNGSVLQPDVKRKVVYNGSLETKTKNFDSDYNTIMNTLIADGGYVQSSNITGTKPETWQDAGRSASMALRVPSSKFDSFITILKGVGNNMSTSISGQDVSLQYYDTEQQLATLRTRQQRLQDMMKDNSYSLKDLIEVEKELSDVSLQIQQMETNLRDYDSLIDFSTINITIHEINPIQATTVKAPDESLGSQISNGFFGVLNVLADVGRGLLIFITAGSPVLILVGIIVILIVVLTKRSKKKHPAAVYPQYTQYPSQQIGQNKEIKDNEGEKNDNNKI